MEEDYESIAIPEQLKNKRTVNYDDCVSLQELASGGDFLTHIYPYQFVDSERHSCDGNYSITCVFLKKTPILKGTVLGRIKVSADVYTFYLMNSGHYKIESFSIDGVNPFAIELNDKTGMMYIYWPYPPGQHDVVVSYEYNCEVQM